MRINRALPQGIVAILNSDGEEIKPTIRRTLSADMSSKQWLQQNGLLPRVPSPAVDSSSSSDDDDDDDDPEDHVWMSVKKMQKSDAWESILGGGGVPPTTLPPPYVHPTRKRSLSEKSLEVCTESLGSETGSDCFVAELGHETVGEEIRVKETVLSVRKYYKESPARPLPPPIPSIGDASFGIRSLRKSGRLVVEAVNVPPKEYLHARREDGRLILSFIKNESEEEGDEGEQVIEETEVAAKAKRNWEMRKETAEVELPARKSLKEYGRGGCKEARRSISMWEPYCIATS